MSDAGEMLVHTEPTADELRGLFRYLKAEKSWGFIGEDLRDEEGFVAFFLSEDQAPMVFEYGGQCIGIVWLTSYEAFPKSAFIHYAVSARHGREMMQAARAMVDAVLDGPNYDLLFAVFDGADLASRKLAERFGFTVFSERAGKVFALRD